MLQVEHLLLINFNNKKYTFWESILTPKHKKLNTNNYSASIQSVPQTCFTSYFQNGKIFPFRKESIFPFQKNHPLSENTKFKLLLCMSLAFGKLKNVSFGNDNHTLKFSTEDFENLPSSFFFFSSENLLLRLSSTCGCIYTSHLGSFILTFTTRWQIIWYCSSTWEQILILVYLFDISLVLI